MTISSRNIRWTAGLLLSGVTGLMGAGCDGLLDVRNPNQLVEDDLDDPAAATAIVNGALASLAQAWSHAIFIHSAATDELQFVGSRDAAQRIAQGYVSDPNNEFTDAAFPRVAVARWTADEAIRRLERFDEDRRLLRQVDLAHAYLYGALAYILVADQFDDFALSDRAQAAPPIGPEAMVELYDVALDYTDRGLAIALAEGDRETELLALATHARAAYSRAVWGTIKPDGPNGDALVRSSGARAAAAEFLARTPDPDWTYRFLYSAGTVSNYAASWINQRLEMRIGDAYAVPTSAGNRIAGIRLRDPIDDIADPALSRIAWEFVEGRAFSPLSALSAREMRLILAEDALAAGDASAFTEHINRLRALDDLSDFNGQVDALELLKHARRTSLFLQGRRLADHYRFDVRAPEWLDSSDAVRSPGTFFPITAIERRSNCYIAGTC